MSLPKITHPIFEETIPTTKTKVKLRPFLVSEEKILLTASQSGERKEMLLAVQQVINNCVVSDKKFDVDELSAFEIEFLFLKLRARSVNNIVELSYMDHKDSKEYKVSVDLNDVESVIPDVKKILTIGEAESKLTLRLKYPTYIEYETIKELQTTDIQNATTLMMKYCVWDVIEGNGNVHLFEDYTLEEVVAFIDDLPVPILNGISDFFENQPYIHYTVSYVGEDGETRKIELRGLEDFFIF